MPRFSEKNPDTFQSKDNAMTTGSTWTLLLNHPACQLQTVEAGGVEK